MGQIYVFLSRERPTWVELREINAIINKTTTIMFTIEEIKTAHGKMKSGADFPAYIQEIKKMGVVFYETFVTDGYTNYFDAGQNSQSTEEKYATLKISEIVDIEGFKMNLKAHQQGKTNYPTFCNDCAKSGIEKWVVDLDKMTCTYFTTSGKAVLTEQIPG